MEVSYAGIVVAVDHDRGPTMEVDILLPPVCHIVGGPPRLQAEVPLDLLAWSILREGGREVGRGEREYLSGLLSCIFT